MRALFWKIPRHYFRCEECLAFTLIPKLTPQELNELYSDYYLEAFSNAQTLAHGDSFNWSNKYKSTIKYLQAQEVDCKSFLDFGCGVDGFGLRIAQRFGLEVSGLEISAKTRAILAETSNCKILSPEELQMSSELFDYILLSDVLEHATEPSQILKQASRHLSGNGVLIIQGPLEGTRSFTNLFLKIYCFFTPAKVSNFLPYHVSLANRKSIEILLRLNKLKIEEMRITETWWPAPKTISSFRALPKALLQILAKLLDFSISFLLPNYGSRFWLVAKKDNS